MEGSPVCLICGQDCTHARRIGNRDVTVYTCPTCGEYGLSRPAALNLKTTPQEDKAKLSAYLRERHIQGDHLITLVNQAHESSDILIVALSDAIASGFPRTIADRLDRALRNLHRLSPRPGFEIHLNPETDYPVVFAENPGTVNFSFPHSRKKG